MDDTPVEAAKAPETAPNVTGEGHASPPASQRVRQPWPWTTILAFVGGLVGVSAIALNAWTYTESRQEIVRLATEVAQLRLSLDLYAHRPEPAAAPTVDPAAVTDLANRLAILEENWRNAPAAAPAPTALPDLPAAGTASASTSAGEDCLPTGTRFMVTSGDSWPICGTGAVLDIGSVDNGFITLKDGSDIAQGGTLGLPGSQCMVGVMPGSGLSQYAEVRVTC